LNDSDLLKGPQKVTRRFEFPSQDRNEKETTTFQSQIQKMNCCLNPEQHQPPLPNNMADRSNQTNTTNDAQPLRFEVTHASESDPAPENQGPHSSRKLLVENASEKLVPTVDVANCNMCQGTRITTTGIHGDLMGDSPCETGPCTAILMQHDVPISTKETDTSRIVRRNEDDRPPRDKMTKKQPASKRVRFSA
jgi:hypothetical protein